MREAGELSERKKLILKAIVESHISDGEPVGSKALLQNSMLTCSSATIRNEMAELEQLGYLEQLHTSSGRIPSELGYRFYVDSLIEHYAMTAKEISELNNLMRHKMAELDQILVTASRVASSMTDYTGIAIKPRSYTVSVKKFETVYLSERSFLLVLITDGNTVKTRNIMTSDSFTHEALELLTAVMNRDLCGLGKNEINLPIIMEMENNMGDHSFLVGIAIKAIYEVMSELDSGEVRVSGIDRLLKYPEYDDKKRLSDLLNTIENEEEIIDMVSNAESNEVNVVIGSENNVKVMDNSALVFKPIVRNGRRVGVIGVIGPRRMDYARVLATLEELGGNISNLIGGDLIADNGEGDSNTADE